ncbi:hypothetical protein C8Q73DRAFT_818490 [Cubamyces lactineus]|nr:hypothetical protein C8Q73DRAFT_818490 [Cubamyces lactineus]
MTDDMAHKAVRLSVTGFVERFWPLPPGVRSPPVPPENPFCSVATRVANVALEKDLGDAFIKAVNAYALTPGLLLRACAHRTGEGTSTLIADGAFYRTGNTGAPVPEDGKSHVEDQIVIVEFERGDTSVDALSDYGQSCPEAKDRTDARGQITGYYAEKAFAHQHRTALFLLFVSGTECCITRWDRSGVIFTVVLDYCKNWKMFCRTLWRMSQCTDEQLGLDPTARRIYPSDPLYTMMEEEAQDHASDIDLSKCDPSDLEGIATDQPIVYTYVRQLFKTSLSHDAPRYMLDVPYGNGTRQYLVGRPIVISKGAIGRGTLGFAALNRETREFAWLKDCWRADYPGVDPEGKILRELNEAQVPYIPTVVCYGDLPGQKTVSPEVWEWAQARIHKDKRIALAIRTPARLEDSDGDLNTLQLSSSKTKPKQKQKQKAKSKSKSKSKLPPGLELGKSEVCTMRLHQHARLVVREIALPLKDFETGNELLSIILDCLEAHYEVVNGTTSRLHRDISSSNIMMLPQIVQNRGVKKIAFTGLLCDWEMSKRIDAQAGVRAPRQPIRSGTWQFKSVMLLNNVDKAVEICDELESFFHVIVYHAVRYLNSNLNETQVGDFIDEYFDTFKYHNGNKWSCGYLKQGVLQSGDLRTGDNAVVKFGHPLDSVLGELLLWFHGNNVIQRYEEAVEQRASPTLPTPASSAPPAPLRLDNRPVVAQGNRWARDRRDGPSRGWKRRRADSTGNGDLESSVMRRVPRAQLVVPTAEQRALAENVKTHDAFLQLLDSALKRASGDLELTQNMLDNERHPSGDRYPKERRRDNTTASIIPSGSLAEVTRSLCLRRSHSRGEAEAWKAP